MPVTIQIRNVPEEWRRILKARAAGEDKSLSAYLRSELRQIVERPTIDEMRARLAQLEPVDSSLSPAEILREERDRR